MDLQTAPAVHPPLLDSVTEETLRRNVAKVLETLAENRYTARTLLPPSWWP